MTTRARTTTVWQVSGGPVDRPYAEVFLAYGVALVGPGDDGPWRVGHDSHDRSGFVRRFVQELQIGDLLLLRASIDTIVAVGIVASGYEYLEPFDDVNGWDLRHARRVRWCRLPEPYSFGSAVFGANPMRFSRVRSSDPAANAASTHRILSQGVPIR